MTFSFNETPYYEQVHKALHGVLCPRIKMSHGIDEDGEGLSVPPQIISMLAGQDELDEALARRVSNFSADFMFGSQKVHGVEFGLNRAIQKGISLRQDDSDGMYYIYHTSGCIVKIPSREVKKVVIPPPRLFDELVMKTSNQSVSTSSEGVSALWRGKRVFPTTYNLNSWFPYSGFVFCKTEQPLYEGHDHECWIPAGELEF